MTEAALSTFSQACRFLDDLQMHKIKLGLDAMRAILADLDSPELRCPAVHVAGTNGKGSVCTMLRSMLTSAGYRTGVYTSPHLSSVRERFRIDDTYIGEADFTRLMERIRVGLRGRQITYFECTTALAFCWFAENDCDVVILETGMGGRLDATNVIVPLVSVITTVSFDHEQYLGSTLEQIAFEKAGIIKEGVPVVSGVLEQSARGVIERRCGELGAPLATLGTNFSVLRNDDRTWCWQDDGGARIERLPPPKNGVWQLDNSACAVAAAMTLRRTGYRLGDGVIRSGLAASFWPGRMEYMTVQSRSDGDVAVSAKHGIPVRFLLDGAHNQAGVDCLMRAVASQFSFRRLIIVWASMGDKNYCPTVRAAAAAADHLLLTRPETERSARPEELARCLQDGGHAVVEICPEVKGAIDRACELATGDDLVVVAGSLYLIGEVRPLLAGEVVDSE